MISTVLVMVLGEADAHEFLSIWTRVYDVRERDLYLLPSPVSIIGDALDAVVVQTPLFEPVTPQPMRSVVISLHFKKLVCVEVVPVALESMVLSRAPPTCAFTLDANVPVWPKTRCVCL